MPPLWSPLTPQPSLVPRGNLTLPPKTPILLLCYDLETTGLDDQTESIIQLGVEAYLLTTPPTGPLNAPPALTDPVFTYLSDVHTTTPITPFIETFTGITQDRVNAAPSFDTVVVQLAQHVNTVCEANGVQHCAWMAHFGHEYDQHFIARYLLRAKASSNPLVRAAGEALSSQQDQTNPRWFWCMDTCHWSQECFPYRAYVAAPQTTPTRPPRNHKLETLYTYFVPGAKPPAFHQADTDVRAMVEVVNVMLRTVNDPVHGFLFTHVVKDTYYADVVQPKQMALKVQFDDLQGLHGATIRWTEQQQTILQAPLDQHMCILAGAGCAKTTTLLGRILVLLRQGVPPHRIMLTTFSRDATDEMMARLAMWVGAEVRLMAGTIDGLSRRLLRDNDPDAFEACQDVGEYKHRFLHFLQHSGRPERAYVLDSIDYLLVDEYQDINETYYGIIAAFAAHGTRVTAVGDDAQNIYSWNGADIQYILEFGFDAPTSSRSARSSRPPLASPTYYLTQNFRSTPEIIRLANQSIARNIRQLPKTITASNPSLNQRPDVYYHPSWTQEVRAMLPLLEAAVKRRESVAVLARSCTDNGPLYVYESECTRRGLPHGLLERHRDHRSRVDYGKITLSTIHKSKGLEWDVVLVVGCTDLHFPSLDRTLSDTPSTTPSSRTTTPLWPTALEEERRLFYVATTRAKKRLLFAYTASSNGASSQVAHRVAHRVAMSRFLSELPRSLFTWHNVQPDHYSPDPTGLMTDEEVRQATLATTTTLLHRDPTYPSSQLHSTSPPLPVPLLQTLDAMSVPEWQRLRNWMTYHLPLPSAQTRHHLHRPLELPAWVEEHHMYADIERWCMHVLVRMRGIHPHRLMERVLKRVPVTRREYRVYQKYQQHQQHQQQSQHPSQHQQKQPTTTPTPPTPTTTERSLLNNIHTKLERRSREWGVPVSALHVSPRTNVPQDVRQRLRRAYTTYLDTRNDWKDLLWTIFEVSWVEPMERGRCRFLHQPIEDGQAWMESLGEIVEVMGEVFGMDGEGWTAVSGTPSLSPTTPFTLYPTTTYDGYTDTLPLLIGDRTVFRVCLSERASQTANEVAREVMRGWVAYQGSDGITSESSESSGPLVVCTYYPRDGVLERVSVSVEAGGRVWRGWRSGGEVEEVEGVEGGVSKGKRDVLVLGV